MSNQTPEVSLIRSAYDLSSSGIGMERYFVESLLLGRPPNKMDQETYQIDGSSNLLDSPIVLKAFAPGWEPHSDYFGERAPKMKWLRAAIAQTSGELCTIVLRSTVHGKLIDSSSILAPHEYTKLIGKIAASAGLPVEQVAKQVKTPLCKKGSVSSALAELYRSGVYPTEEFVAQMAAYKMDERLREHHIKLHADKLELMLEVVYGALENAAKAGRPIPNEFRPDTLDSQWAQNWRRLFGEEFPTLYELIEKTEATISVAQIPKIAEVNKPIKYLIVGIFNYQESNGRPNPFMVKPCITGQTGGKWVDVTPDNPDSLNLPSYSIAYRWGRTAKEYIAEMERQGERGLTEENILTPDVSPIASLSTFDRPGITFVDWNHESWDSWKQARQGFRKLAAFLQTA